MKIIYLGPPPARLHYSIHINNENNKSYTNKLSFYCRIVKILDTYPGDGGRVAGGEGFVPIIYDGRDAAVLNSSAFVTYHSYGKFFACFLIKTLVWVN